MCKVSAYTKITVFVVELDPAPCVHGIVPSGATAIWFGMPARNVVHEELNGALGHTLGRLVMCSSVTSLGECVPPMPCYIPGNTMVPFVLVLSGWNLADIAYLEYSSSKATYFAYPKESNLSLMPWTTADVVV